MWMSSTDRIFELEPGLISSYVASGFTTGSPDKTTGFLGSERERGLVVVVLTIL